MNKKQTYIEGAEPFMIDEVEELGERYAEAKRQEADAKEVMKDIRPKILEKLVEHEEQLVEENGHNAYFIPDGRGDRIRFKATSKLALSVSTVKGEGETDDDESEDE